MKIDTSFKPFTFRDVLANYNGQRKVIGRLENPRHRKIARNYLVHSILEAAGQYEVIFSPEMTVENPVYEFFHNGVSFHGREACKGFYQSLVEAKTLVIPTDQKIAVGDWGFCSEHVNNAYISADTAKALGLEVTNDDDVFVEHRQTIRMWPYTPDGRLMGETLYYAKNATYSRHSAEHALDLDEFNETVQPLIDVTMREYRENPPHLLE
ncbi:MAG: hypothetical protein AB7R90_14420 [Reyranellaceae bacterium]